MKKHAALLESLACPQLHCLLRGEKGDMFRLQLVQFAGSLLALRGLFIGKAAYVLDLVICEPCNSADKCHSSESGGVGLGFGGVITQQ